MPESPFDDYDDPWDPTSSAQSYTPKPRIDGELSGYELVEELYGRSDIGSILQQNPQARAYSIVHALDLGNHNEYGGRNSLVTLILSQPPKVGIAAFVRELGERIHREELTDVQAKYSEALTEAVTALLTRTKSQWDKVKAEDLLLALEIQQATGIAPNEAMSLAASKGLETVALKAPERVTTFVTAFHIDDERVRMSASRLMHSPKTITALRAHNVPVPPNDDPEFRKAALEMVMTSAQYSSRDCDAYRIAYEIPEAEYRQAVWIGLVKWVSQAFSNHSFEEFHKKREESQIEFRTDDPVARAIVIETMSDNISANVDRAKVLHDLFALTAKDMQPIQEKDGKARCLEVIREDQVDVSKLQKLQAIFHMTTEQVSALAKEYQREKLLSHRPQTPTWEDALIAAGYMTQADVHENLAYALRAGMSQRKSWHELTRIAARLGTSPAARLDANETVTYGKERYLDTLRRSQLRELPDIEQLCDLSLLRGTPEEHEAAKIGMQHFLEISFVDVAGAKRMQQLYHLNDTELQQAAEGAAITHLGAGWHAQLEAVRREFAVEDALRSEAARLSSKKVVKRCLVDWLRYERSDYEHRTEYKREENVKKPYLTEHQADIVLQSIAIGGYDADGIEAALIGADDGEKELKLLPHYEAEHTTIFLKLKRQCPHGFTKAFTRQDVRDHADIEYITPALANGDEATVRMHVELTDFPKEILREIGYESFVNNFRKKRYSIALSAARICAVDEAKVAETFAVQMRTDATVLVPHLDEIPLRVLDRLEREFHLRSFYNDIGIPSAAIYSRYVELVRQRNPLALTAFISSIQEQLDRVTSGGHQDASITEQPFYRDIVTAAYPNNAGHWTSFENNEACENRSEDLVNYTVRNHYSFTVTPGQDMVLKEGRLKDREGFAALHDPLEKIHKTYEPTGFEREPMLAHFDQELGTESSMLAPPEVFTTREERLCGLFLENMQGNYAPQKLKHLLMSYQYAAFQDIREYLQGTRARAEQSRNPEYAYLLELREFFADRLKDVARKVLETALQNPALRARLPHYFAQCAARETAQIEGQEIARMQIDKLGLAPGFIKQLAANLHRRTGKTYTEDETRALIREYEDRTTGLAEGAIPEGDIDPAILGQIRSQRTKTIRAVALLSGINVHPSEIRLEDVNLQELLNERRSLVSGEYNEETFASYMGRRFSEVFGSELSFIDAEIAKYEAKDAAASDAKPKRVEAFITKNHTSAHARATAGVCVSGDNPRLHPETQELIPNQWQMPNYLQMILRDSETKLCKGCVLMHVEEDQGQKILTVSLNPSSTYLYQVNEEEMFRNLRDQLIVFAKDNQFDAIAVSTNKQIRTNRTGGLFERAIDKAIVETKQGHTFTNERTFSHKPRYQQQELDYIWVAKPKTDPTPAEPVLAA